MARRSILDQLAFYKKAHKTTSEFQLWQEGMQPKLIVSEKMMLEKINPFMSGLSEERIVLLFRWKSAHQLYMISRYLKHRSG